MADLKGGTIVNGTIQGTLNGNADTASKLYTNQIAQSTDLDTIITPGLYICESSDIAASLTNSPINDGPFAMQVDPLGNGVRQTVYNSDLDSPQTIIRTYANSVFSNWNTLKGI